MAPISIPDKQTVALVRTLGGPVEFVSDYPVKKPGQDEVLAKVLYCGVCQSDLHTRQGTAAGPDGKPITNIKLPHIGGHEGVGRIVALGSGLPERDPSIYIGALVGIRFASRICRRCEYCLDGKEQYCQGVAGFKPTNHLHHEDGAFQEYVCLDAGKSVPYMKQWRADFRPNASKSACAINAGAVRSHRYIYESVHRHRARKFRIKPLFPKTQSAF